MNKMILQLNYIYILPKFKKATFAAQASSALLCFLYLKGHFPALLFFREDGRVDRDLTRRTLRYGLVSAL